jgi:hypothetical protein
VPGRRLDVERVATPTLFTSLSPMKPRILSSPNPTVPVGIPAGPVQQTTAVNVTEDPRIGELVLAVMVVAVV